MNVKRSGLIVCMVVFLTAAWGAFLPVGAAEPSPDDVALSVFPAELLRGKTQSELEKELPVSGAYRDETTPIAEDVEVDVDGTQKTYTVLRYLSDIEILQYRGDVLWTCIAAFLVLSCRPDSPCWRRGSREPKTPSTS